MKTKTDIYYIIIFIIIILFLFFIFRKLKNDKIKNDNKTLITKLIQKIPTKKQNFLRDINSEKQNISFGDLNDELNKYLQFVIEKTDCKININKDYKIFPVDTTVKGFTFLYTLYLIIGIVYLNKKFDEDTKKDIIITNSLLFIFISIYKYLKTF